MPGSRGVLRPMREGDVPAVVALQEPAAVAGLSEVFPQDLYPFPRQEIAARWRDEVASPDVECFVIEDEARVVGFAALSGAEVLHFGTARDTWGSGLAAAAHDELVERLRARGVVRPEPYAELLTYELGPGSTHGDGDPASHAG